jgi:hypothetical protein
MTIGPMLNDKQLFGVGFVLASAWVALIRIEGRPWPTFAARFVASVGIPLAATFILWAAPTADQTFGIVIFLTAMAIPLVVGTYLFSAVKRGVGTLVYLVLLLVTSGWYVMSFNAYLRS